MKQNQNLYEYLYQTLVSQFLSGAFLPGQRFPSQREICMQYNVGITTVRRVMKMLDEQKYIRTAQGQSTVVIYESSTEMYIAFLVQRRDEIADAYRGLELLMPILYREGARRCTGSELKYFHELIDGISEQMKLEELYKQANAFFITLLRPMKNQLIIDLELDSENYLHIPYIPIPSVENPFALTANRLKIWMQNVVRQIENKQFDDLCGGLALLYQESAKRVDDYLCALSKHTSAQIQIKGEVHWFHTKGHSELYARLAMTMIRRIVGGEFDGQKYLPSIPKLMEEYGVMKDTVSRAVALLNALGFAQTLDKKGTIITGSAATVANRDIDLREPVIQERLTLFLDALQIIALTVQNCAVSFSSAPDSLVPFIESRLFRSQDNRFSPLSVQLLMGGFIQLIPYHSIKNIFQQLEELIIWGHYLQTVDKSFYPDPHNTVIAMKELVAAMKEQNNANLAHAYGKAFSLIYKDTCKVVSKVPGCLSENRPCMSK